MLMTWYKINGRTWPAKITIALYAILAVWAFTYLFTSCHTPKRAVRFSLDTIDRATISSRALATTFHVTETIAPLSPSPSGGGVSAVALPPPFVRSATITALARDTTTTTTHTITTSTTTHTTQPNISTPWPFSLAVEWPRLFFVLVSLLSLVLILRYLR